MKTMLRALVLLMIVGLAAPAFASVDVSSDEDSLSVAGDTLGGGGKGGKGKGKGKGR